MPSKFWDMEKNKQQTDIITDNFVSDIRTIIEQGRKQAYAATGQIAIMTYWNIGRRIVEEEQQGASRAAYGQKLIPALAVRLAAEYGTGYGKRNLAYYRKFYLEFKDVEILHTRVQILPGHMSAGFFPSAIRKQGNGILRQRLKICGA